MSLSPWWSISSDGMQVASYDSRYHDLSLNALDLAPSKLARQVVPCPLIGLSRCGGHVGDHAGQRYNCNQHENNPSHTVPPSICVSEPMRNLAITARCSKQGSHVWYQNSSLR